VLTDQVYGRGVHTLHWEAVDVASGTYFYRLESGGKLIQMQTMKLIK